MKDRKFKVVVVDNEQETRFQLTDALKLHHDVIISAEAGDAATAIQKITEREIQRNYCRAGSQTSDLEYGQEDYNRFGYFDE